jgi:PAS domain-containing protein
MSNINYLTLINHSSDFVSLSDLDGNVTYVNAAGRKMLGIKNTNDIGGITANTLCMMSLLS